MGTKKNLQALKFVNFAQKKSKQTQQFADFAKET
jgi:hypothetical protein